MLVALAALVCGLAHRQISAALSSLRVRTLVIPYRPLSLSQYYCHKSQRPARYALNADVAHADSSLCFFPAIPCGLTFVSYCGYYPLYVNYAD